MTRHFCDACGAEVEDMSNLRIQCKVQGTSIFHSYTVCSFPCAKVKAAESLECMNLPVEVPVDT